MLSYDHISTRLVSIALDSDCFVASTHSQFHMARFPSRLVKIYKTHLGQPIKRKVILHIIFRHICLLYLLTQDLQGLCPILFSNPITDDLFIVANKRCEKQVFIRTVLTGHQVVRSGSV